MSGNKSDPSFAYFADKVYVHQWPLDSPPWPLSFKDKIDSHLHKNKDGKKIVLKEQQIKIDDFEFDEIKKFGITIPLFKKETTIVFEGQVDDLCAHVHITTHAHNYLETFNSIMLWKDKTFPD